MNYTSLSNQVNLSNKPLSPAKRSFPVLDSSYKQLTIILIRPSKYDDDGYVIRHFRGTLPSNTLSCLNSLTEAAIEEGAFGDINVHVETIDEIVTKVNPKQLARRFKRKHHKVVVGLVGVQTNQFPRAQDLARQFRDVGFEVAIGGFHVSGVVAMFETLPPECREMLDIGVTLVAGEVEDRWADILRDALQDKLQPFYNYLGNVPDLYNQPIPKASAKTQRKFVLNATGTIDAGRGCPFNCSFCTIVNVQGRKMRYRSATQILDRIRGNYFLKEKHGITHYFFTDDNFARNPEWEEIFDGLIHLREEHGIAVNFMMQVDVLATRIPNFVDKAARAGCVQTFIGMESIRDDNLEAAGKRQNKRADYKKMIERWHEKGVVIHVGYIIGFPHDTYQRVMEDIRTLRDELLVDQASFFMLTPLPGSVDHQKAVENSVPMNSDYNTFDSFHATAPHPRMSAEEWTQAFNDAWKEFYSFEAMRKVLLRQNPHTYWAVLKNMIWYRAGMIEGAHPMITGFYRFRDRKSRRPGFPIEKRWPFLKRRFSESYHLIREYIRLYFEMQELWLLTRIRREEYAFLGDLRRLANQSMQEAKLNWARVHTELAERVSAFKDSMGTSAERLGVHLQERLEDVRGGFGNSVQAAGQNLSARAQAMQADFADLRLKYLPPMKRPNWWRRFIRKINLFSMSTIETRSHLSAYWKRTGDALRHFKFWRLNPFRISWNLARDTKYTLSFFFFLMAERY